MQNIENSLRSIMRYAPGISLSDAFSLLDELSAQDSLSKARRWAEINFSKSDVTQYKIKCITTLRKEFATDNLGLKDAKDILDTLNAKAYYSYF